MKNEDYRLIAQLLLWALCTVLLISGHNIDSRWCPILGGIEAWALWTGWAWLTKRLNRD